MTAKVTEYKATPRQHIAALVKLHTQVQRWEYTYRMSLSLSYFKQNCECASKSFSTYSVLLISSTALRTFQGGWINFWVFKRKRLQAGSALIYHISAAHTHFPLSHIWQESLRSDVTHQLWQSKAKFFYYSLTMPTQLFPLPSCYSLVVHHNALHSLCVVILKSTLFYRNLHTVKIRSWSYSNECHVTAVVVYFT